MSRHGDGGARQLSGVTVISEAAALSRVLKGFAPMPTHSEARAAAMAEFGLTPDDQVPVLAVRHRAG